MARTPNVTPTGNLVITLRSRGSRKIEGDKWLVVVADIDDQTAIPGAFHRLLLVDGDEGNGMLPYRVARLVWARYLMTHEGVKPTLRQWLQAMNPVRLRRRLDYLAGLSANRQAYLNAKTKVTYV